MRVEGRMLFDRPQEYLDLIVFEGRSGTGVVEYDKGKDREPLRSHGGPSRYTKEPRSSLACASLNLIDTQPSDGHSCLFRWSKLTHSVPFQTLRMMWKIQEKHLL